MSKTFTRLCNGEPDEMNQNGYRNENYNSWLENCLRQIVKTYEGEYSFLGSNKEKAQENLDLKQQKLQEVKTESTKSFSSGETAGIGAASATGGIVLGSSAAMGLPVLIKWLLAKFV